MSQVRVTVCAPPYAPRVLRNATYLLTGMLKCAYCGGSLTMINQRCYGCGTRNRGGDAAFANAIRIRRNKSRIAF